MIESAKLSALQLAKAFNQVLLIGLIVSFIVIGGLGFALVKLSLSNSTTLVPPTISKAFTVSDGAVDDSYLEQMGSYFLQLKLNLTPKTAERQFGLLLDYVHPESFSAVRKQMQKEIGFIDKSQVSSRFDVQSVIVFDSLLMAEMTGILQKYIGERALEPEKITMQVWMDYSQGQLTLKGIKQKEVNNEA